MAMNIPQIASVEVAVSMYYEKPWLSNKDIHELFPGISTSTVQRLKNLAREKASELGMMQYNSWCVLTKPAYIAWGLDIDDLEKRLSKLRRLGGKKDERKQAEAAGVNA